MRQQLFEERKARANELRRTCGSLELQASLIHNHECIGHRAKYTKRELALLAAAEKLILKAARIIRVLANRAEQVK